MGHTNHFPSDRLHGSGWHCHGSSLLGVVLMAGRLSLLSCKGLPESRALDC